MGEITVVGCGAMGSRLINAFMEAGNDVVIVDLNKEKAEKFIARGARYAETLQDAPETEAIIINVPHNDIARKIIESCTYERLQGKYYINTTGAASMFDIEEMGRVVESRGMKYLEAKIESYPDSVGPDTGYMVYAGSKDVFDKCENLLSALGRAVYVGENPAWAWISDMALIGVHHGASMALFEVVALGMKYGYPLEKMIQIVSEAVPICLEVNYKQIREELANYDGNFEDSDSTDLIIEERGSHMVLDSLETSGVEPIISKPLVDIFQRSIDEGYGRKNMVALVNMLLGK